MPLGKKEQALIRVCFAFYCSLLKPPLFMQTNYYSFTFSTGLIYSTYSIDYIGYLKQNEKPCQDAIGRSTKQTDYLKKMLE